jgi:hypothetical protein
VMLSSSPEANRQRHGVAAKHARALVYALLPLPSVKGEFSVLAGSALGNPS